MDKKNRKRGKERTTYKEIVPRQYEEERPTVVHSGLAKMREMREKYSRCCTQRSLAKRQEMQEK